MRARLWGVYLSKDFLWSLSVLLLETSKEPHCPSSLWRRSSLRSGVDHSPHRTTLIQLIPNPPTLTPSQCSEAKYALGRMVKAPGIEAAPRWTRQFRRDKPTECHPAD